MYRYYKIVLKAAVAVALVACAAMLSTTQASAQFGFEGIIRGAISHGYYGGYSRHHGRVHESRHGRRSKSDEADDEDSSKKGKDSKDVQSADKDNKVDVKKVDINKADVKPASANQGQPQPAASTPAVSTAAASTTTTPAQKPNTDIPAFTPSR